MHLRNCYNFSYPKLIFDNDNSKTFLGFKLDGTVVTVFLKSFNSQQ